VIVILLLELVVMKRGDKKICVPGIILGVKGDGRVRLTTLLSTVSQLSRKCGSLDVSQPYVPPRPVEGIHFTTLEISYHCVVLHFGAG
jgi:hypothetical protein